METVSTKKTVFFVTFACFLLIGIAFYPGFLSPDPIAQLIQARSGLYSDWHPPIMSFFWRLFDKLISGAAGMLFFHLSMVWGATGIFAYLFCKTRLQSVLFVLSFGFFPPILGLSGMVWKDVGMGASLLMGVAFLSYSEMKKSQIALLWSLPFLFYGFAVRLNAAPALWPLMVWVAALALRLYPHLFPKRKWINCWILGTGLMVLFTLLVSLSTSWMIQGRRDYPIQQIYIFDLGAISVESGEFLFPEYVKTRNPVPTLEDVKQLHNSMDAAILVNSGKFNSKSSEELNALKAAWWKAIKKYPIIYINFKLNLALRFLHPIAAEPETYAFGFWPDPSSGKAHEMSRFQSNLLGRVITPYLDKTKSSILFSNGFFFWLIPILLLFNRIWSRQWSMPAVFIGVSGFLYTATYIVICTALNFRYSWWTVIATVFMIPWIFFQNRRAE